MYHLRIGIAGALTLILAVTIFVVVHIRLGVHTVHDLDVAHIHALLYGLPNETVENAFKPIPLTEADKTVLELGQG